MALGDHRDGGRGGEERRSTVKDRLTPGWLKAVKEGNSLEFEREMERHRRRLGPEVERFWRAKHPTG